MTARNAAYPEGTLSREVDSYLEAVPGLEESLDFRMASFRKDGDVVCWLADRKKYLSLHTCGRKCLSAFGSGRTATYRPNWRDGPVKRPAPITAGKN